MDLNNQEKRINEDGNAKKTNAREVLQVLREEIGEKAFEKWGLAVIATLQQDGVLRQNVYEKGYAERQSNDGQDKLQCTHDGKDDKRADTQTDEMSNLWERAKVRCASQGWQLGEQQQRQFDGAMQKLSSETTSAQAIMQSLWETSKGIGTLQQALHSVQEVWRPTVLQRGNIRIRRLTEKECWRLQGFTDEQHDKAEAAGVSMSQRYKQAGNAISVNVAYAIGLALKRVERE